MPIVTQGHQVQVMPQYTAMDPSRVTFNPMGFAQGALSSIEIINQLAQQRAFAQQQAELAATRDGRLGAMNANNLAAINLAPQKNLADIALAQQQAQLAPVNTQVGLAQGGEALARLALAESLRPVTNETAGFRASTENTAAATDSQLASDRSELERQKVENEKLNAPLKQTLTFTQLNQDIESIANDKALTDAQKIATIRNLNASAAQSEAAARRSDRDEVKRVDPLKELDDIQMQIQRLQATPVINPNADTNGMPMPMLSYQAQTRDPSGAILKLDNPFWFTGESEAKLNPEAERVAEQLRILQDRRAAITQALASPASSAGPAATKSAVAAVGPSSPQDLVAQVKAGKISKEAAKEYATSKGWK